MLSGSFCLLMNAQQRHVHLCERKGCVPYDDAFLKLMRQALLILSFFLFALQSHSQHRGLNSFVANEQYFKGSKKATAFYKSKEYLKADVLFDSLYNNFNKLLSIDKYNAACCWSLVGNSDKAFLYLNSYAKDDKELNILDLLNDSDLVFLHSDPRWKMFASLMQSNIDSAKKKYHFKDTTVNVGSHNLHFKILKGNSTVILFEAGGLDDSRTWGDFLMTVHDQTGATLVAYDRAGFGKSTRDSIHSDISFEVRSLETGLKKLGYEKTKFIVVCHSLGGLYSTLFISRNKNRILSAVYIDASISCFYNESIVMRILIDPVKPNLEKIKRENVGIFYIYKDIEKNINVLSKVRFPVTVPIRDIISDNATWQAASDNERWEKCHREFCAATKNRVFLVDKGCNHYIFKDNPRLIINEIATAYKTTRNKP